MKIIITEKQLKQIINESGSNNTMVFWHGGNLDEYTSDAISQKKDRTKYGPGLYLITKYSEAIKYSKGSRKLYQVTVEKGNDINDSYINYLDVKNFIATFVPKNKRNEIITNIDQTKDKIKASILVNILLYYNALNSNATKYLRQLLIDNNIDYELIKNPFGWRGEYMMVLYNMNKIKEVKRVSPKDKIENFDLGNMIKEEIEYKPEITFLIGPPASGKSTWREKNQKNAIVISRDDIVDELRAGR